jgi:hypothetical protein
MEGLSTILSQIPMAGAWKAGGTIFAAQFRIFLQRCNMVCCRVFKTLEGMWAFAMGFLASLQHEVIGGSAHQCCESNTTELRQGNKFRRYEFSNGAAVGPSEITDVVLRFLSNFQADCEAYDLDQPVEDFNDDLYSLPPSAVIPNQSYFS